MNTDPPIELLEPRLPNKPSELLTVALNDLIKTEKDPRYKVDMYTWHDPHLDDNDDGHCFVCLAGSVIAQSLEASPLAYALPGHFDSDTRQKLVALDYFQQGQTARALGFLGKWRPFEQHHQTPYAESPERFKKDMWQLVTDLQQVGS